MYITKKQVYVWETVVYVFIYVLLSLGILYCSKKYFKKIQFDFFFLPYSIIIYCDISSCEKIY